MTSIIIIKIYCHFFSSVLQPTRPISKSLIDNIFLNTIEYSSYSGNITIQIADHLLQFVILEGFFHDIQIKNQNIKERNFKHFNGREFLETIDNINIAELLCLEDKNPNKSVENFYTKINYILDEMAPYKKLNNNQIKLKTKPWIDAEIQHLMWKRDKIFKKICNASDEIVKQKHYDEYKKLRNQLTTLKRSNKIKYYKNYFEKNGKKTAVIWKGIRTIITIKPSNKADIKIVDNNGVSLTDPVQIANCFNNYFVNVGSNVERKIPQSNISYTNYLQKICVDKSFYVKPANVDEILEIINHLDTNKSLGPNSLPIYILNICNFFFQNV